MAVLYRVVFVFGIALAVMTAPAYAQGGVGVRITGGYSYITYSDFNDFVEDFNAQLDGEETLDEMHWVSEFSGEVTFSAFPGFTVGVGAGIVSGKSDWAVAIGLQQIRQEHKMRAYPFTLTGYFEPPAPFTFAKPLVYAGVGAYRSTITFRFAASPDIEGSPDFDAELTDWGFGVHGGAGLRFKVAPIIDLDLGIKGRWATIKGYEGTATSGNETKDVVLVKYVTDEGFRAYGVQPAEDADLYEEGKVDLSGYGFVVSVVIGF
ncbi:MAG: outer membrane beta-barrel protein [bacterium]|nr:MAG: outer membrane beta-barrel protein [bacterium]